MTIDLDFNQYCLPAALITGPVYRQKERAEGIIYTGSDRRILFKAWLFLVVPYCTKNRRKTASQGFTGILPLSVSIYSHAAD
jgi:hypothetical protein